MAGNDACRQHINPAAMRNAEHKAKGIRIGRELDKWGLQPVPESPETNGAAQLSLELRRTIAWINFCERQINALESERDFVWGITASESTSGSEAGTSDGKDVDKTTNATVERYESKINVWVERLDWNREHMLKITKQWLDAGFEAQRLNLERSQIEQLGRVLDLVVMGLGHNVGDSHVREVIRSALTVVDAEVVSEAQGGAIT